LFNKPGRLARDGRMKIMFNANKKNEARKKEEKIEFPE